MTNMSETHKAHKNGYIADQRDFFDSLITKDWDTYINSEWDRARQLEVSSILDLIPSPAAVLDMGCGCGYHDLTLAQHDGIVKIVGIDNSPKSIETANKEYPHSKIERAVADIFDNKDIINRFGQFDLVSSFQVIEHLNEPAAFIDSCASCALSGGFVSIVTPNVLCLRNRIRRFRGLPLQLVDPLHFMEYSISQLEELGHQAGLSCIGSFAHMINLAPLDFCRSKGIKIIDQFVNKLLPGLVNVIGIVFIKP